MPRVPLGPPPTLGEMAKYSDYRDYLLEHFVDHLCSYCLLHNLAVAVDHHVPVTFAPQREHDPTNLLLACPRCNGPGGKGDYHPHHRTRRRRPHDTTGYSVLDVREEDFAQLFTLGEDGRLDVQGPERDRAAWNVALLKLDLLDDERREVVELAEAAEIVLLDLAEEPESLRARALLEKLTPALTRRVLLLEVLGLALSAALRDHLRAHGARLLDRG